MQGAGEWDAAAPREEERGRRVSVWPKGGGGPADEVTGFNEGRTTALPLGPRGKGRAQAEFGCGTSEGGGEEVPLIRSARGRRRGPVEAVKRAAGAKEVLVPRLVPRPLEGAVNSYLP